MPMRERSVVVTMPNSSKAEPSHMGEHLDDAESRSFGCGDDQPGGCAVGGAGAFFPANASARMPANSSK
ncbi:MAG: hypothetical protein IPM54_37050 [Polyangiaceae bacterium]|nr:hypothetical protein [Polyangiaceae bacterium]